MNIGYKRKLVLLGMISRAPVAGVLWQTIHYLVGFQRLGYEVYYVEDHARTPLMLINEPDDDGSQKAAELISSLLKRFDLGDRWAFHASHSDGQYYGMSEFQLKELFRTAELIINLHGNTVPLPEHIETNRLIYVETDPVAPQIELYDNVKETIDFLDQHRAFFTFGENYGNSDCLLPVSDKFVFHPTRQPVLLDMWKPSNKTTAQSFTTIGSWCQSGRDVVYQGETYFWSKHYEFLKFIDLPLRTKMPFELALNRCDEWGQQQLTNNGWTLKDALGFSTDMDDYQEYIWNSRGEFTVAKDQNVRLRSGWFSDRSASYLASGRPVITQDTGFGNHLPIGEGLFAFSTIEEIEDAVESINSDYQFHSQKAFEIAKDYFSFDIVLPRMLDQIGL